MNITIAGSGNVAAPISLHLIFSNGLLPSEGPREIKAVAEFSFRIRSVTDR